MAVLELHQTVIAQGDPVGVPGQVFQHLFRPAKGLLGIDHPVLLVQCPYRGRPSRRARQGQGAPSELELAGLVGRRTAARYLPRKTSPSTWTDKNQLGRQDTQRGAWSSGTVAVLPEDLAGIANPPPGTTQ